MSVVLTHVALKIVIVVTTYHSLSEVRSSGS